MQIIAAEMLFFNIQWDIEFSNAAKWADEKLVGVRAALSAQTIRLHILPGPRGGRD